MSNLETEIILKSELPVNAKLVGAIGSMLGEDRESIIQSMISVMNSDETVKLEKQFPRPRLAKGYNETEKQIVNMMIENTGSHMLDSGGIYGRHWQTNRMVKDFRDSPRMIIETNNWNKKKSFSITLDLFAFLSECLEFDKNMNYLFTRFANRKANKELGWMEVIDKFLSEVLEVKYNSGNSYNHDNCLSQTFQWHEFQHGNKQYVIIQTHNGCDVRGGYSIPKVFTHDDYGFLNFASIYARCDCSEVSSDNGGYSWYDSFPKTWNVSTRKNGVYCMECKQKVEFS